MRTGGPGFGVRPALASLALAVALTGCGSAPKRGGYYQDDGPGGRPPVDLDKIADAKPRVEPLNRGANNPYTALGKKYVPYQSLKSYRQRGMASWYGRQFHGKPTSSGERYDMYAMTAAHTILPIPSYARVTNLSNSRSVIVRINDRGPFHSGRIIDLSYAAAYKLGYIGAGSALVEVEAIMPKAMASIDGKGETAAPVVEVRPPEIAIPVVAGTDGVYLQLGAFSERASAENLRVRIYQQLNWLNQAIDILPGNDLFRLRLGPYPGRAEATGVADRIRESLDLKPILVGR